MKTMRQMLTRSLRMIGQVGEGNPAPVAYQMEAALECAKGVYASLCGLGTFGPITDVLVEDDYEAGENERITNTSEDDISITLPEVVTDSYTGLERAVEDRSFVMVTGEFPGTYIRDAEMAEWVCVDDLTLDLTAPLSGRYANHLEAIIAAQCCPDYGIDPPAVLVSLVQTGYAALRQKKPRRVRAEAPVLRGLARRGAAC